MAQEVINLGSAPNDGTGDKLRVAFTKVNNNFTELYQTGGGGGVQGVQGIQGIQGTTGQRGALNGASFEYDFSNNTDASDPGTGTFKFNNADLYFANTVYIDTFDINNINIGTYLITVSDSTSAIKGHIRFGEIANSANFALFEITSAVQTNGYISIGCNWVAGSANTLPPNDPVYLSFDRTGDKGDQGIQGVQGTIGSNDINWISAPSTNTSIGVSGQTAYDANGNLYICVAENTWSKIIGTTSW